jgi:type VI secretion system secreted protein VgrG
MSSNRVVMSLHSAAIADGTLQVANATGVEALSQPFRFDLDLVSEKSSIDLAAILGADAHVSLFRTMVSGDGRTGTLAYDYHGMIAEMRQVGRAGFNRYRYSAVLRPQLWKLSYTRRSRIFVDKNVPDLLKAVFADAGITYKMKLSKESAYPIYRYAVQYEESDLDFISRWMEQVGISYYYDIDGDKGTVIIIDSPRGFAPISPYGERVSYDDRSTSGLTASNGHQRISRLDLEEVRIPRKVQLKDYNCESPDEALFFEAEVDPKGLGTWYEYNSNYRTESEGRFLLGIRREYWLGRRQRVSGDGDHRCFQPGRTFTPANHFNPSLTDRSLVLLEVRHTVKQEGDGDAALTGDYSCTFTAMPAALAYRPERATPWPSIHGVVHGRVVGGALAYAELDDMGRYKIDANYDATHQSIGKVRMAQPSVGEDSGQHFPLRKDTEVLLGHIDGDPDKPIILGAVHDGKKTNVLDKNQDQLGTKGRIKSQGGSIIEMNDDPKHKHMTMANGSLTSVQQFGRPEYTDQAAAAGSSSTNPARQSQSPRARMRAKALAQPQPQPQPPQLQPQARPQAPLPPGDDGMPRFAGSSAAFAFFTDLVSWIPGAEPPVPPGERFADSSATFTDSWGFGSAVSVGTITASPSPVVDQTQPVSLSASVSNTDSSSTYTWTSSPSGAQFTSSSSQNPQVTLVQTGNGSADLVYTLSLAATDAAGNNSNGSVSVTVKALSVSAISAILNTPGNSTATTVVEDGVTVNLSATITGIDSATTYLWSCTSVTGPTTIAGMSFTGATTQTPTAVFNLGSDHTQGVTYTIQLTVTNRSGLSQTTSTTISVVPFQAPVTAEDGASDSTDPTSAVEQFWTSVSGNYDDSGLTANTIPDWRSLAMQEFTAIYTMPVPTQGDTPGFSFNNQLFNNPPVAPMGWSQMSATSLGNPPDPATSWLSYPLLTYPGQQPALSPAPDFGKLFANFTATAGGTQKFSLGDDIWVMHGDQYLYRRGTICSYQIGDQHNFGVNGNTYNYNWGNQEVTFNKGPTQSFEYSDDCWEYKYSSSSNSFENINGPKVEVSQIQSSNATETVYGLAKETSNVGEKIEFSDVGASLGLACGGAQFEMSLNGPKLSIEAELCASINLALKAELEIGASVSLSVGAKAEFEVEHMKIVASDSSVKALEGSMTAVETKLKTLATKDSVVALESEQAKLSATATELKSGLAQLDSRVTKIKSGIHVHL